MSRKNREYIPHFRRGLQFVWPHKRYLFWACVSVFGISLFYTVSLTSVVPFLKIMVAQHETLADWVHRENTERRLACRVPQDVPRNPETGKARTRGLFLRTVNPAGSLAHVASRGDRILEIDGRTGDHYEMLRIMASVPRRRPTEVMVQPAKKGAEPIRDTIWPRDSRWYTPHLLWLVSWLPAGHDTASRLESLAIVMGLLVLVTLLGGICRFFQEYACGLLSQRAMIDIRTHGYGKMLALPMSWFDRQQSGDTLSRFARDSVTLEAGIRVLFGKTLREPFKALGVLILAAAISPLLLLSVCAVAPIAALLIRRLGRKIRRAQRKALQSWSRLMELLEERIQGIRVVKAYHMERREALRFFRRHRELMREQLKIFKLDAAVAPLLEVAGTAAVGGIAVTGGYLVFVGTLEAEIFFALVVCIAGIFDPIRRVANVNNKLQAADAAAQRIFEVVDQESEESEENRGAGVRLEEVKQGIEFHDVHFAYPTNPDRPVLRDINLRVRAGEIIALVGPNGSGKTTLCSLLLRFYDPQRGRILIDGTELPRISLGSLRGMIGLVTQDTVIFTDTARNNIAYGRRHVDEQTVLQASRSAYADEFIREFSTREGETVVSGYDGVISGQLLSGGQKQRIAIARAVVRDPAILVLDEATSQIDAESEVKIQQALHKIMQGRTTFVIAHRFSTISEADRIVVMDEGQIVATGKHEQLIDQCPLYRTLYETQFRNAG